MNTENLDLAPDGAISEEKSEKNAKVKKAAGNAAKFAAAAGLGVAGTMAAKGMNHPDEEPVISSTNTATTTPAPEDPVEDIVEEPVDFDPNDIMIEDPGEIVLDENSINPVGSAGAGHDLSANIDEPQPITSESTIDFSDNMATIDIEEIQLDGDLLPLGSESDDWLAHDAESNETMDEWSDFDDTDSLFADNGSDFSEPDILDDILNA